MDDISTPLSVLLRLRRVLCRRPEAVIGEKSPRPSLMFFSHRRERKRNGDRGAATNLQAVCGAWSGAAPSPEKHAP